MMEKNMEAVRKGPWTEQEDVQLVFYVNLFGDRRWDFIAKVSGLKRTGKSCRLRWVNYLHPGLKRVKMTPHEERLVLDLHKKWGNRWSRIARKLPGRTDNEIKNYWRTHMRKKAQERKKGGAGTASPSSSSSSSCSSSYNSSSSSVICDNPANKAFSPATENKGRSFYDTGGKNVAPAGAPGQKKAVLEVVENTKVYSMDEIWKDIELSEEGSITVTSQTMGSLIWDFCPADSLWSMDEEASKTMMQQIGIHVVHSFPPNNNNNNNTTG